MIQKIRPFLWFNDNAEEAANFYVSLFPNSKITNVSRYQEGTPGEPGKVMLVNFELEGLQFLALNGGPIYEFNNAVSFYVDCSDQTEVDHLWDRLGEGGKEIQCGWITDRFGLTWQIVPRILGELLGGDDQEKAGRVMQAMLKMVKLNVDGLLNA